MADVFISYARDSQAMVRRLAEAVKREGYSVWWDDELPPHRSYGDVITEQIAAAKAAIVVWSESAAASQWVRAEADAARTQSKLIQISLDGRVPPMPFSQIHATAIDDWQGEDGHPGWLRVKESLAALAGAGAGAPPAHPMPAAPPRAAAPQPWRRLLIGVIVFSLLVIAAVGLLAWRGRAPPAVEAPPTRPEAAIQSPAAPPSPARAAEAQPSPKTASPPRTAASLRGARRYCLGRGRTTPECRQLRAQRGR
jgi:hypothetical protein